MVVVTPIAVMIRQFPGKMDAEPADSTLLDGRLGIRLRQCEGIEGNAVILNP
jgi:hypothetical protein